MPATESNKAFELTYKKNLPLSFLVSMSVRVPTSWNIRGTNSVISYKQGASIYMYNEFVHSLSTGSITRSTQGSVRIWTDSGNEKTCNKDYLEIGMEF